MKNKAVGLFAIATLALILTFGLTCCQTETGTTEGSRKIVEQEPSKKVKAPDFDADKAYQFIADQVAFGPRVPSTPAQKECANYLEEKLKEFGAVTIRQEAKVTAFDSSKLDMINIIGQFQPEKEKRVLLFAHWDTRPFADKDPDESKHYQAIDGANDGGSGVGVLLEVARQLQKQPTDVGIDIIFFDTEDYGSPNWVEDGEYTDWCLGSQYWAANPHVPNYNAEYGILLDMVGGKDAVFPREGTSLYFASSEVRNIWKRGRALGYGNYFVKDNAGQTTDDHLFVSRDANIPSACIVEFHTDTQNYGTFHHTHDDNMDVISTETLKAVGQTLLEVIYQE